MIGFWLVPVIVMAIGFLPMPYGYYNLLRFVVSGSAIYFAHQSYVKSETGFTWIFAAVAILYNPFIPIYLYEKEIWTLVNLVTSILFFIKR